MSRTRLLALVVAVFALTGPSTSTLLPEHGLTYLPPNPYTTSSPSTTPTDLIRTRQTRSTDLSGSYLITAPWHATPGFNFSIGQPGMLNLPVPENIGLQSGGGYYWEVKCLHENCTFFGGQYRLFYSVSVIQDVTTIFVQTDKAIYKPGQMVHYRVFAVYPDLQMYDGNFWIEIKDPNGNKIQHMSDVASREGVVEGSLGLADQPVFGDWVITVQIQTATRFDTYSKSFTVNEYQLPRFEVVVDMPSYALTTDENIQGSVKATYTFGQPVKGKVELHVSRNQGLDSCGNEPRHMELSFDIDGEAKFSVPKTDISRVASVYSGSQIKVTAFVKEELTDVRLEGSTVVTFRSTPYKVRILDNTPSVFKPGLPYSVFAQVSMQDDSPVPTSSTTLTMVTTAHYSIPSDNSFLYSTGTFAGTYALPIQDVDVPPNGVVKIDLSIPANATSLDVTVDYKGVTDYKSISKMFSSSNTYLQLSLLGQDLTSRQTARLEAKATESMGKLWYQVLSRGLVCESKVVDTQGQHVMTFDIPLTPMMAPTAHVMAYYVRSDGEIVPDAIAFNVEGVFNNEVTIEMSTNKSEPHTDLDVYLTADPNSVVHLLAVDQSVLLVKSGNDVTPGEVATAVGKYDAGNTPADSTFALSLSQESIRSTLEGSGLRIYSDVDLSRTRPPYESLPPAYPHMQPGQTFAPGAAFGGFTTTT
ncbi:hypothetical protein BaRGS_00027970, partial [Batillaria attramentaria]